MPKYLADWIPGEVMTSPAITVTETHVVTYAWCSGDSNPMHTDASFAERSPIGQRIAHGTLVMSMATGLSARMGGMDGSAIAALGVDEWKFLAPVFLGDTIRLRATTVSARPAAKGARGVVTRRMDVLNQRDELVQTGLMTTMVMTAPVGAPASPIEG